jgi:hypothetical protein
MKQGWIIALLWVVGAVWLAGCGNQGPAPTTTTANSEKEFDKLYKQYSARFYERMSGGDAETLNPNLVMAVAAKTWDEVFSPHKDLLKTRCVEILKNLDDAAPLQEELYIEATTPFTRSDPVPDTAHGAIVPKQLYWSPVAAAANGLGEWLAGPEGVLRPESRSVRAFMLGNASLSWEAIDRNIDHPRLQVHQGAHVYQVDLLRIDDFYATTKMRWLKPKPKALAVPTTPAPGGPPVVTPGTTTTDSAATTPVKTPTTTTPSVPPVKTPPAKTPPAKTPATPKG